MAVTTTCGVAPGAPSTTYRLEVPNHPWPSGQGKSGAKQHWAVTGGTPMTTQ